MSTDQGWSVQAVTALDVNAMIASENIANANRDSDPSKSTVRVSSSDVSELAQGKVYDSAGQGFLSRANASPTDEESWNFHPLTASGVGGPQDLNREYFSAVQLDQADASSVATAPYRDQQYIGHIVDYTA
ncbi:MAG: hypothetical protein P4L39_05625 [Humidesulfovibrio sp.]|nr:hypothetical protein [Humidesulfovibrio sp.]